MPNEHDVGAEPMAAGAAQRWSRDQRAASAVGCPRAIGAQCSCVLLLDTAHDIGAEDQDHKQLSERVRRLLDCRSAAVHAGRGAPRVTARSPLVSRRPHDDHTGTVLTSSPH